MAIEQTEMERAEVEGVVERIVYESTESGFFVARLRVEGQPDLVTFVGNLMAVSPGETVRIAGRWVDDKKWGRQIRAERYETVIPNTVEGIERYLGSGLIHGIGKVYAKRLIEAFGAETLKVIDQHPERLTSVEGIGAKRASQIREAWVEQKAIQSIMIFLQGHGVSTAQAVRIYKQYGDGAIAILRENPYQLTETIAGIGFAGADKIASSLGIAPDAPMRLEAGLEYVLQQASGEGHDFLREGELIERASRLLQVNPDRVRDALTRRLMETGLVREEDAIYLGKLHGAESGCAEHLKRLVLAPKGEVTVQAENAIRWVEKTERIELSPEQKDAIRTAAESKVMVVTGGPGTGKTTLINCLIAIFEKKQLSILLAAPTGRAAKRMEAATGRGAKTIHRLLEFSPKEGGFTKDEDDPLDADLIVIDEMSMVDVQLMDSLLRAAPTHARLFLVGDVDQLPSVGPGNVLMDVIASTRIPTVRLETVFRQAAQSGIIANAHRINRGEEPRFNTEDCFFVERDTPEAALETVIELVTRRIPKKFGLDPLREIQVLSPMHRGEAGVTHLNERLQEALNPSGEPISRQNLRVGDKVIQVRNNYELDVYNGDVGVITLVNEDVRELHVRFEDREVLYEFDDLDNLHLAYAITVHKSQGSEYPAVVLPLARQHYLMLQRNVLYTAISRARRLVIVVGHPKALQRAIRNTEVTRRNTRLAERLREAL